LPSAESRHWDETRYGSYYSPPHPPSILPTEFTIKIDMSFENRLSRRETSYGSLVSPSPHPPSPSLRQIYLLLLTSKLIHYFEDWIMCCIEEAKRKHLFQFNYFFSLLYSMNRLETKWSTTNCLRNCFLIDFQRI
jgi:hypothetical protein